MPTDLPDPDRPLRIGTRGSPLALAQAHETRARLMAAHGLPEAAFAIVVIKTTGDRVLDRPLTEIGGKGLFTREIEDALLAAEIDIAVHSMKDMPTLQPDGLGIACYLPREDVRDAFVTLRRRRARRAAAPARSSAPRACGGGRNSATAARTSTVVEFRGNVQTRLRKLEDGAGRRHLPRHGRAPAPRHGRPSPPSRSSPRTCSPPSRRAASGSSSGSATTAPRRCSAAIHHAETGLRLAAERAFLLGLDGSCQTPIAGLAELTGDGLRLRGEILRPDGSERLDVDLAGAAGDGAALGAAAAADLRGRAASDFFEA